MKQLDKLRKKIDLIDAKILDLFNKRSKIAIDIGKEKKSNNLFRPERQANILKALFKHKNNNISPEVILSYWRNIFLSQIDLQGGIELIILSKKSDDIFKSIYDYFSHDVKIIIEKKIENATKKVHLKKNRFLVLPYPGSAKFNNWWVNFKFEKTFVIATLPFLAKKGKKPNYIILSKYFPMLEKDCCNLYISEKKIDKYDLIIEAKYKDAYFYKSYKKNNDRNLKCIGGYPKQYEK